MKELAGRIDELFSAERSVRRIHAELAKEPDLLPALDKAIADARRLTDDKDERALRLVRAAELLGELGGPLAVDRLIDLMGDPEPEPRVVAGEALQELGYARFKEVAQGVERALARLEPGHAALAELPYMLAEIPEGGVLLLMKQFLQRKDPEPVAAAIEAVVEIGDPAAIGALRPLAKDKRTVSMEELEDGGVVTIGELASEALELFEHTGSLRRERDE